jgi:hypothetical protein
MSQIQATPQSARFTRSHKRPRFPTAHKPAPSLGGSGAGLLEACLFPQPLHDIDPHSYATGENIPFDSLRDDFHSESVSFGTRGLDATNHIACGSVWPFSYAGGSWGNCSSVRARTFA